jgi:hypothetical protein
MTEYRAPTGMPEDWGLYPKSVRPDHAEKVSPSPVQRTASVVRNQDFGAAILVTDGSGNPFYVPKDKAGLVQLILDAARVLREMP